MSIGSPHDLPALREVGRIVRLALEAMRRRVAVGVTTAELDRVGANVLALHGARSAPAARYGFPGCNCISVNDEAVHGIPGPRPVQPGDLVKLDVTAEKDGYIADAAITVGVAPLADTERRLVDCAERAFHEALAVVRAGNRIRDVGRAVEDAVHRRGFRVLRELHGHGVGREIHESPTVPNYFDPRRRDRLTPGLVITLEPIIAVSCERVVEDPDGWTVRTADGGLSAHFEHTLVVTEAEPLLLTAA